MMCTTSNRARDPFAFPFTAGCPHVFALSAITQAKSSTPPAIASP